MKPYGTYERIQYNTASLPDWVSISLGMTALKAVSILLLALAFIAVGLALFAAINLAVIAATPMVAGCCSATVAVWPQIAAVVGVFYFMWLIKP